MSSTDSELRKFGLVVGGLFLLIGWRPLHHGPHRLWALALGAMLVLVGAVAPRLLKRFHWVWMKIGSLLGTMNAYLICTLIFFGIITPLAVIMRLLGKDLLGLEANPSAQSYAEPVERKKAEHFRFQF